MYEVEIIKENNCARVCLGMGMMSPNCLRPPFSPTTG
jgi:hypothetical protein